MKIHKYPLDFEDTSSVVVMMPVGAKIIHFAEQYKTPTIWAEVDTNQDMEPRRFKLVATEGNVPYSRYVKHIGSYMTAGGAFVGHVYEVTK